VARPEAMTLKALAAISLGPPPRDAPRVRWMT
jgi:hypothetical protein